MRFEDDPAAVAALYRDAGTVKLFYKEHDKYSCFSRNWGANKGMGAASGTSTRRRATNCTLPVLAHEGIAVQ